jgi:uncharacterized membrane protein
VPTAFAIAGVALAVGALALDESLSDDVTLPLSVASTAASARSVLSTVASATMTFAGIAFSVVLLVFQMSSSEYSPRVIHGLLRDGFNKRIIGLVVGTFTYCLVTLRSVHGPVEGGADAAIPTVSVSLAVVLGVVAVLAIVGFIDHNAHRMDVSRILDDVTVSTREAASRRWWPEPLALDTTATASGAASRTGPVTGPESRTIAAPRGGWVQQIDVEGLMRAIPPGATAALRTRPGRYAVTGSPLVEVRTSAPSPGDGGDDEGADDRNDLDRVVADTVVVGPSRTITQDPAYGLRQIVDVALRALSPGVNDPTTAQDALFHLADALHALLEVEPPPRSFEGDDGRRVVLRHRSDAELVELAFGELCGAAASQPAVVGYLLAAIDSLLPPDGGEGRDRSLRRALLHQAERAVAEAARACAAEGDVARLETRLAEMERR